MTKMKAFIMSIVQSVKTVIGHIALVQSTSYSILGVLVPYTIVRPCWITVASLCCHRSGVLIHGIITPLHGYCCRNSLSPPAPPLVVVLRRSLSLSPFYSLRILHPWKWCSTPTSRWTWFWSGLMGENEFSSEAVVDPNPILPLHCAVSVSASNGNAEILICTNEVVLQYFNS